MVDPIHLKDQLSHTWPAFFARHGNFTPVQQQALPPILAGKNTLVIAATASGKTEAALAPLLERHLFGDDSVANPQPALRILYICPTRALVRDLYERLAPPLQTLGVTVMMKSGDTGPVSTTHPPTVLITTPESTDSLLTRAPRLLTTLRAFVLDEVHLFGTSASRPAPLRLRLCNGWRSRPRCPTRRVSSAAIWTRPTPRKQTKPRSWMCRVAGACRRISNPCLVWAIW